jgi:hypothetical protein
MALTSIPIPPPTLEDIGHMLWGPLWEPCMAAALNVTNDRLQSWIEDPTAIPSEIEKQLVDIAVVRIEEIELAQAMVIERGINREALFGEGTEED